MDQTKVITLDLPVEWNNATYEEIRLREPSYGEVLEAQKRTATGDSDAWLVSKISGVPMQAILKMPGSAVLEAAEILNGFLSTRRTR